MVQRLQPLSIRKRQTDRRYLTLISKVHQDILNDVIFILLTDRTFPTIPEEDVPSQYVK